MKFVAVTACPTGIAHTHMAAEALRHEAMLGGHEIVIETQGSEGPGGVLGEADIAAADAVIVAADIHVDPARFAGAGGLLIAISYAFDIHANDPHLADSFAGRLNHIGSAALTLFLPVFAGFIAFSIADRPISLGIGASTVVPHGGIFDLFVPGAIEKPPAWLAAIVVGSLVTTGVLFFTKRPVVVEVPVDEVVAATATA